MGQHGGSLRIGSPGSRRASDADRADLDHRRRLLRHPEYRVQGRLPAIPGRVRPQQLSGRIRPELLTDVPALRYRWLITTAVTGALAPAAQFSYAATYVGVEAAQRAAFPDATAFE